MEYEYQKRVNSADTYFIVGYNQTHTGGLTDISESVQQAYSNGGYLDYDLRSILNEVHGQLNTRKVLLVGYSQGSFYTNEAYEYLVAHGVPKESIAVFNVATPADMVEGGGNWLTSSQDKVISSLVSHLAAIGFAHQPLPANINIPPGPGDNDPNVGGHLFGATYLAEAPDRIVQNMQNEMGRLSVGSMRPLDDSGCFVAPSPGLADDLQGLVFLAGDTAVNGTVAAVRGTASAVAQATSATQRAAVTAGSAIAGAAQSLWGSAIKVGADFLAIAQDPSVWVTGASPALIHNIQSVSASSPSSPSGQPSPPDAAGKVATALPSPPPVPNLDPQNQIDDILNQIDLLQAEINAMQSAQTPFLPANTLAPQDEPPPVPAEENETVKAAAAVVAPTESVRQPVSAGVSSPTYPTVLISEVQTEGRNNAKEEFVELYNPSNVSVSLDKWYLQKKTKSSPSWSSFASSTLFAGKTIGAKSYFLAARSGYFGNLEDIFTDSSLADDNALALKNPNGDISDEVGWGGAPDAEGRATANPVARQSIGRLDELDTNDNAADFGPETPTPKAANRSYVSPIDDTNVPKNGDPEADTQPPGVSFSLNSTQDSPDFSVAFTVTDAAGGVSGSGVASYVFRWREQGGDWQQDDAVTPDGVPQMIDLQKDVSGRDETGYEFQVQATDAAGNVSDWLPQDPAATYVSVPKKVLINEVQIDSRPGAGGTDDDWVELYNPNDVPVSLAGWSVQKHSADNPCSLAKSFYKKDFPDDARIAARGFYLIASTKASDALQSAADMTASWSLSGDNTIYLVRSPDALAHGDDAAIVDKVGFGSSACFAETAPAPLPPEGQTIQRVHLGTDTDNNAQDFAVSAVSPKSEVAVPLLADASNYSQNLAYDSTRGTMYNLSLVWPMPAGGRDVLYDLQYRLGDGAWQNWKTGTADTQGMFQAMYSLLNNNVYEFRAAAKDADGNQSDWADLTVDCSNPLVINEFAAAGTDASADDRWVELYNKSDAPVDLAGWQLVSGPPALGGVAMPLSGTVDAGGYFLVEPGDGQAIAEVSSEAAGMIWGNSNGLSLLAPNGRWTDQVWQSLNPLLLRAAGHAHSFERVSPYAPGNAELNWLPNDGASINGSDRNGDPIYGTPGRQNSVGGRYVLVNQAFGQDTVLPASFSPYLFAGANVAVAKGVTLSLEPGAVVKFLDNQSSLLVNGTLLAQGTDDSPIVFTSFKDDGYGGDSNGDGDALAPFPGDWLGITLATGGGDSQFSHVIFRYAGATVGSNAGGVALFVQGIPAKVQETVFEHGKNRALVLENADAQVTDSAFSGQFGPEFSAVPLTDAIQIFGGSPLVENTTFSQAVSGITMQSYTPPNQNEAVPAAPVIHDNTFEACSVPVKWASEAKPDFSGNKATNNSINAIQITVSSFVDGATLQADLPYLVEREPVIPAGATVVVDPGVRVFFDSQAGLQIDGTLLAQGTQDEPVTFGPYNQASAKPGSWMGLYFTKGSIGSQLDYVDIGYAGLYLAAGIRAEEADLTITNSMLHDNADKGLLLLGSSATVSGTQFSNNSYGIYLAPWHDPSVNADVPAAVNANDNIFSNNSRGDVVDTQVP